MSIETSRAPDPEHPPPPAAGARAGRWVPHLAVAVAASASAMGLAGVVPSPVDQWAVFVLGLLATGLTALLAGARPALLGAAICALWIWSPWFAPALPRPSVDALLFIGLALATIFGVARLHRRRAALAAADAALSGMSVEAAAVGAPLADGASAGERGLLVLMVLVIVLPFVLYALLGWAAWQSTLRETSLRLDRIARAAQEHASKVMDTNEMLLGRVQDMLAGLSDQALARQEQALHARLVQMTGTLAQVLSIWVHSAAGRPLVISPVYPAPTATLDVSDRDFFVWHRENRGGLYISQPAIGRLTREPFFNTARRREDAAGGFAGIVQVSLKPAYFSSFYADLAQAEPGLSVALFRSDGILLARHPSPPAGVQRSDPTSPLMQRLQSGEHQGMLSMRSAFDGKVRTIAFRSLGAYPVFVAAGIERATIVAAWRKDMAQLAALLFPASAALVMASWFALQRARREHAAQGRVRQEIGQRLRAEAALVKAQKLQALGQITGSVAHDFNNLLAVVANSAHVIRRSLPAREATQPVGASLDAVDRAVRNGVHLTRQLLAFSRRQALRPVDLDLRAMLPRTLELLRTSLGSRVQLEMTIAPDLAPVHIDEADLELALLNLVLNARDAMPDGGLVHIDAANDWWWPDRAAPTAAPPDAVRIRVRDDGGGIDPALLQRVFEPFFTTKPESNGTGLGLSQVRAACEQAGGQVAIDSLPGAGTTVTLRLPALRGAAQPPVPPARETQLDAVVLLVEDEADVAHTTMALLETFGARVRRASSGAEAIALIAQDPLAFDVVLTDVVMPGPGNGLSLARRLRSDWPGLPVVLMTGFTAEMHAAVAEGFEILPKPCEPAQLSRALADAARGRV